MILSELSLSFFCLPGGEGGRLRLPVTHRPYHIYLYIYKKGLKEKIEMAERAKRALNGL